MSAADLDTPERLRALEALCDAFVPALDVEPDPDGYWARSASDLGVPAVASLALRQLPPSDLEAMLEFLDLLSASDFAAQSPAERELRVRQMEGFGPLSPAINGLRSLTILLAYAVVDPTGVNPNWKSVGYPGPTDQPAVQRTSLDVVTEPPPSLEADVCVVGSGCGGSVAAAELARAGRSVVVLETGGYFTEADFVQLELWAYQALYLNGGPFPTAGGGVTLLAGSCVGGGSTVNYTNCVRPSPRVREEWASRFGLSDIASPSFDAHLDAIWERLAVTDACSDLNGPHLRLQQACEALGYSFRLAGRNTDPQLYDPQQAGYMGFGDRSASKLSTPRTFLADAVEAGARVIPNCRAERLIVDRGRAAGVLARSTGDAEAETTVRARSVVLAGGAVETPALLLRSDIDDAAIGENLSIHPSAVMVGIYEGAQESWWGPPQAGLCDQFRELEAGYGFLVECPHISLGTAAASLVWRSGEEHKSLMASFPQAAGFAALLRDRGAGRVTLGPEGRTRVDYEVDDELDRQHLRRALGELACLHRAAGAREIHSQSKAAGSWRRGEDFDAFRDRLREVDFTSLDHPLFSGHQMGSCRIGADPAASAATPAGELRALPGAWVADASAVPSAVGANPMITIMAFARRTAQAMLDS